MGRTSTGLPWFSRFHFTRSRTLSIVVGGLLGVTLIPGIPVAWAAEGDGFVNAVLIVEPGPPPPPVSEEDREQVEAWNPQGMVNPDVFTPDLQADPEDILADLAGDLAESDQGSNVYEVDDASHLLQLFSGPVNYQNESGKWVPISTDLVPDGQGGVKNEANHFTTGFPGKLSLSHPITVELVEGSYHYVPQGILGEVDYVVEDERSITYSGVFPEVDFTYRATATGYEELITLHSPQAAALPLIFDVSTTGLDLRQEDSGEISVLSQEGSEELIGIIPAPLAFDSSVDPDTGEAGRGEASQILTALGGGQHRVQVIVDPLFLTGATYPVIIDPGEHTFITSRDGWVDEEFPSASYETGTFADELRAGRATANYLRYAYVRFNLGNYKRAGRTVISAQLSLWPTWVENNAVDVNVRHVTEEWASQVTWNNKPDVGNTIWASDHGPTGAWYTFNVTDLYQNFIDLDIGWDHYGVRLAGESANPATDNYHRFASKETSIQNAEPQLYVYYNDPPSVPTLAAPDDQAVITYASPTLTINHPIADHNGDDVMVNYQLSTTSDFADIEADSGYIPDEDGWTVPAGVLKDGQTYWWRALAWDVCDPDTLGMCNLMGRPKPTSAARQFSVTLNHFGSDPRWPMWSDALGNGMRLQANEATGNLYLEYPLDSISTAAGALDLGLAYNHQDPQDNGLGAGWVLSAGPGSDPRELPTKLKTKDNGKAVEITLKDGDLLAFSKVDNSSSDFYSGGGAMAGVVKKNKDSTWIYTTSTGSQYVFDASKNLSSASLSSNDTLNTFTYLFSAAGHLKEVTDPLGRKTTYSWDAGDAKLQSITTNWDARTWTIGYDPTLTDMIRSVTDPTGAVVEFGYDAVTRDLVWVEDGENRRAEVGYVSPPAPASLTQVAWAQHPGYGSGDRTEFTYEAPYTGQVAARTIIKDPRYNDPGVSANSYTTYVTHDKGGLPVRVEGPANNLGFLPITTSVWDTNGNLVCQRGPAANAKTLKCLPTDTVTDNLQTDYTYEEEAPFRKLSVTGPAPNPDGTGTRPVTTYAYDTGFTGLYVEKYDNDSLSGIPTHRETHPNIDFDWGSGHPVRLTGNDTFSLRWTGRLYVGTQKTYRFRLYSNDGVTLVIGKSVKVDCFGSTQETYTYNCGSGQDVKKQMNVGWRDITVNYQEKTGNARVQLKWDAGNGGASWSIVPSANLSPNLGDLTSETSPSGMTTTYAYAVDSDKVLRHPSSITRSGTGVASRTTTYTYDDYGRILTDANFAGTLTNTYTSNSTVNCLSTVVDRSGAEIRNTCNGAGDATEVRQIIRAKHLQPYQERVTTKTYDGLGRLKTVVTNDGTYTRTITNDYFLDGSLKEVGDSDGTTTRTTSYLYNSAGRLWKETLPDPDGGGPLASPVIEHTYDQVGNETELKDPRAKVWKKSYDASNRVVTSSNPIPSPNTSTTTWIYDDTGQDAGDALIGRPAGVLGVATVWITDPAGVKTYTKSDLLGRKISEQIGSRAQPATLLSATTYEYDAAGNVTKVTDPTGVWTRSEYNPFSELKKNTARTGTGGAEKDTTYAYDNAGRLDTVTDARGKVTDYSYDAEGRITTVLPPGLLVGENAWALAYSDAGELVRTTDPNGRIRDFTFDVLGRASTYTETRAAGYTCPRSGTNVCTTTSHYNGFSELASVDDPRNITLHFVYDNLGRRTRRCQVCTGQTVDSETYEYDPAGNLTKAINADTTVEMTYDDAGRLDVVTQGQPITDHSYDAGAFKGLLTSRADPAGTTSFSYDAYGRLGSLTDPLTNAATTYGYDGAGRVTSRTDPAQITTTRTYDTPYTGRALTETVKDSAQTTLASFTWAYDEVSNVASAAQTIGSNPDNGTWVYSYDDMNRLQTATLNSTTTTYGYDGAGNRTSVQVGGNPAVTTTYDTAGLPTSSSDTTSYTHDAAGNMTGVSGPTRNWTLTYDSWGRIASATGQPQITYLHDALDRLFRKNRTGVQTTYSYIGLSEDPAREAVQGGNTTFFAWSSGGPITQKQGSTVRVYEQNLHGDAAMLATPAGGIAGTQAYKPFGERGAGNMAGSLLSFQSDMTDQDTGFVDMGARLYDPVLGRFTSRDPLFGEAESPMSLNRYVYGWDNPASNGDPNGLYCVNYGEAVRCNDATSGSDKPTKSTYHSSSSYSHGSAASASAIPAPPPVPPPPVPRPFWIEVNTPVETIAASAAITYFRYLSANEFEFFKETGYIQSTYEGGTRVTTGRTIDPRTARLNAQLRYDVVARVAFTAEEIEPRAKPANIIQGSPAHWDERLVQGRLVPSQITMLRPPTASSWLSRLYSRLRGIGVALRARGPGQMR